MTRAVAVSLLVLAGGCFYSSTWHQEPQSQRRQARALTPESSPRDGPSEASGWRAVREARVRVWATPQYQAEVHQWRRHVEDLFARAREVTDAALGIRLVLVHAQPWSTRDGAPLATLLTELEAQDAGEEVDFVVGLVGSTRYLDASLESLGTARVLGKHMVLRAMNDAAESEAIETFDELSAEERMQLRRRRKNHRELTVLLHEVGHALGALHVRAPWALMNPTYDIEMRRYAPQTLELLRPALRERALPESERDDRRLFEALTTALRASEDGWVRQERDDLLTRLEAALESGSRPSVAVDEQEDDGAGTLWDVTVLPEDDRTLFYAARTDSRRGQLRQAWQSLASIVERHSRVYAVQELACELVTRGAAPSEARRSCQRMMDLSMHGGGVSEAR